MAIYTGIDASIACTAVATVEMCNDGTFNLIDKKSIVPSKKLKGFDKKYEVSYLFKFIMENIPAFKDTSFVVFENYSYGSPGHLADLGELTGLLKNVLKEKDKDFFVIAPTTVKKLIVGKGNAKKDEVKNSLSKFLNNFDSIDFNNYDESDACAVAIAYGLQMKEIVENESEKS